MSESVNLQVDSLNAEATEAVKNRAALSASTPDLISSTADGNSLYVYPRVGPKENTFPSRSSNFGCLLRVAISVTS
jgi:hypothetical protein